jgi:hypothetical protein
MIEDDTAIPTSVQTSHCHSRSSRNSRFFLIFQTLYFLVTRCAVHFDILPFLTIRSHRSNKQQTKSTPYDRQHEVLIHLRGSHCLCWRYQRACSPSPSGLWQRLPHHPRRPQDSRCQPKSAYFLDALAYSFPSPIWWRDSLQR